MEKKAIICIIYFFVFSFASKAQLAFEVDSIALHTLSNTERIEDTVHTLYSDIWRMGPIVDIYGRLINYSEEDLVLKSIWENKETGEIVTDVSIEFSTVFEYKGKSMRMISHQYPLLLILYHFHQKKGTLMINKFRITNYLLKGMLRLH